MDLDRLPDLAAVMNQRLEGQWAITGSVGLYLTAWSLLQSGAEGTRWLKFFRRPGDIDILIHRDQVGMMSELSHTFLLLSDAELYEFHWPKVNLKSDWTVVRVARSDAPFHGEFLRAGVMFGTLDEVDTALLDDVSYPVVNPYALLHRKLNIIKIKGQEEKAELDLGPTLRVLQPYLLNRAKQIVPENNPATAAKQAFVTLRDTALTPGAVGTRMADIDALIREKAGL